MIYNLAQYIRNNLEKETVYVELFQGVNPAIMVRGVSITQDMTPPVTNVKTYSYDIFSKNTTNVKAYKKIILVYNLFKNKTLIYLPDIILEKENKKEYLDAIKTKFVKYLTEPTLISSSATEVVYVFTISLVL